MFMDGYQEKLKAKMKKFAHLVYKISKRFPKDEMYGMTSQVRRASLSVLLNCVEGYARQSIGMTKSFLRFRMVLLRKRKS